jgi:hypothetical protein
VSLLGGGVGGSAYAGAANPITAAALVRISRRLIVPECCKITSEAHPASAAEATCDKCSAGVNVALGVGHGQRQSQFFQRSLLGCHTQPEFNQARNRHHRRSDQERPDDQAALT